jgi:hypothetical protein
MFEHFSGPARRAMVVAVREARRSQHDFLGTEHVLFGLLCDSTGSAALLLNALGTSSEAVLGQVHESMHDDDSGADLECFPLTPGVRRVFAYAEQEARQFGQTLIGPDHLLLGLLGETTSVAAHMLAGCGITFAAARRQLLQLSPADKPEHLVQSARPLVGAQGATPEGTPTPQDIEAIVSFEPIAPARPPAPTSTNRSTITPAGWLWFLSIVAVEVLILLLLPHTVAICVTLPAIVFYTLLSWTICKTLGIRLFETGPPSLTR